MSKNQQQIKKLAVNGVLAALVCVVSFIPLRTLGLEITFSMVPVAIGACLYGPVSGAVLGLTFGFISFIQCFGYSAFGAALLEINPILTFIVCVPTRMLAGYLAGLMFKVVNKVDKTQILSYAVTSLLAPLFNTLFFMSTLCLCFYQTETIQGFVDKLGATNPITFVILFVGINGLVEIICGFVVALPASKAVSKALKRR